MRLKVLIASILLFSLMSSCATFTATQGRWACTDDSEKEFSYLPAYVGEYRKTVANLILSKLDRSYSRKKQGLRTMVQFYIMEDGGLLESSVKKSSRNLDFDDEVLKAIEESVPFPPFPREYKSRDMQVIFTISG